MERGSTPKRHARHDPKRGSMATQQQLFRREALDRMESPEKVDEYIRVSTPAAWMLASALALVVVGVLVWGFTGSIAKTVSARGVIFEGADNDVVCLLPVNVAGPYLVGHEARITLGDGRSFSGTVKSVAEDPWTYEEVQEMARSNWRLNTLWGDTDALYQYALRIGYEGDTANAYGPDARELVSVEVVTSDVRPIQYVLN